MNLHSRGKDINYSLDSWYCIEIMKNRRENLRVVQQNIH